MTSSPIERWVAVAESGDSERIAALLADDVVFNSPALFAPQRGRPLAAAYLTAASTLFGGSAFRYVDRWEAERSAVLEFEAHVDGRSVNGVDIIGWNDDGLIVSFKVMVRPYTALQAVMARMAALLAT